ncbi:MAG: hypothetical protein A2Z83_04435 [Omnitrophica bacterium GWA2_52_8]|nr:MAG: hypothetical protein A2Z83_04435 [Omnitrophica bacterium GWA2_52_8]
MASRLTFVTGGMRSGKSAYALNMSRRIGQCRAFIATAEPLDHEMRARIARHKDERKDEFDTVEQPLYLAAALSGTIQRRDLIVVDCLTVWLNNLFHHFGPEDPRTAAEIAAFVSVLENRGDCRLVIVSNEIGMGMVPEQPNLRRFTEELGRLNRLVAQAADEVFFLVAGVPLAIKGRVYAAL